MTERSEDEPSLADLADIAAFEAFHDQRRPTTDETLERARRLASESMRAIALQLRRFQSSEPEDTEWHFRRWMDFQFLIIALWRLRTVAEIAAAVNDAVRHALIEFDQDLPDLRRMRNVSQHLDDYATDHPTRRRQTKPGTTEPIGRRLLEVGTWDHNNVNWLGGTLNLRRTRTAAEKLYASIRATGNP